MLYTAIGGLKATLSRRLSTYRSSSYSHYFTLAILTNEHIGGFYGLYDKVSLLKSNKSVVGNYQGSFLTIKSKPAILFGIIAKVTNLALVTMVIHYIRTSNLAG
jgi:hypothetical protein